MDAALHLCPSGCQFFYSSALLPAQSRWLWLRVELNLVYVRALLVGLSAKSIRCVRSLWPSSSLSNHNLFCSSFPTLTCKFASPVPLISQPASRSLFQPLSLPATEGNKMLLLWKRLPERQLMRLPACRQKPIYGHFLSEHQQMGTALDEHRAF